VLWWLVLSLKVGHKLPAAGLWNRRLLALLWLVMLHMVLVSNAMDMVSYHPFGTTLWWVTLGLVANLVQPSVQSGHASGLARA
jgi:hypothetical protein